jgi:ketosteroid isomerase-like protein
MLRFFLFFSIISFNTILSQNIKEKDSLQILDVLETQRIAWNNNDINEFMQGYLKSDKLVFSGSNGTIYGWNYVKERYLKTYSSKELMGYLDFDINDLFLISKKVALLLGKFNIKRDDENLSGYFTLVFKKIKGNWYIVSDHTS